MSALLSFSIYLTNCGTSPIFFDDGRYLGYLNMDNHGTKLHARMREDLTSQGFEILHSKAHGTLKHRGLLRVTVRW